MQWKSIFNVTPQILGIKYNSHIKIISSIKASRFDYTLNFMLQHKNLIYHLLNIILPEEITSYDSSEWCWLIDCFISLQAFLRKKYRLSALDIVLLLFMNGTETLIKFYFLWDVPVFQPLIREPKVITVLYSLIFLLSFSLVHFVITLLLMNWKHFNRNNMLLKF